MKPLKLLLKPVSNHLELWWWAYVYLYILHILFLMKFLDVSCYFRMWLAAGTGAALREYKWISSHPFNPQICVLQYYKESVVLCIINKIQRGKKWLPERTTLMPRPRPPRGRLWEAHVHFQRTELFAVDSRAQIQLTSHNIALFIKHKHAEMIPPVHSPPKSQD